MFHQSNSFRTNPILRRKTMRLQFVDRYTQEGRQVGQLVALREEQLVALHRLEEGRGVRRTREERREAQRKPEALQVVRMVVYNHHLAHQTHTSS